MEINEATASRENANIGILFKLQCIIFFSLGCLLDL